MPRKDPLKALSPDLTPSDSSLDFRVDTTSPPSRSEIAVEHMLNINPSSDLKYENPPKLTIVTYTSPAAAAVINTKIKEARTALIQLRKERKAARAVKGCITRRERPEARIGPERPGARNRRKLTRAQKRKVEVALFKEEWMQREVEQAKQTRITPQMIQTLDISTVDEIKGTSENRDSKMVYHSRISVLMRKIMTVFRRIPSRLLTYIFQPKNSTHARQLDSKAVTECTPVSDVRVMQSSPERWGFAGDIVIQERVSAMTQALSEHTQDGPSRKEPGRHAFHVDAAVSRENILTGLAVVYKSDRQDGASPWTARGYRIYLALEQQDAETWAIWQALQCVLEKVQADRESEKPRNPYSLAVVYSDCKGALYRISNNSGEVEVQLIIRQSVELKQLGVDVQLHWVPGHRNVPGNELADLVANKARLPAW